jgi:hypothetical protein
MMNDEECVRSLRAALPGIEPSGPARDLWLDVLQRTQQPVRWSIGDWSAAAVVAVALLMFPKWFWFLAYHL